MSISWVITFWSFGFFWLAATCFGSEAVASASDSDHAEQSYDDLTEANVTNTNAATRRHGDDDRTVYAVNFVTNSRDPQSIVSMVWCMSLAACHVWLPIYTAAVVSVRAQLFYAITPMMRAAIPRTLYGAAYLVITAVEIIQKIGVLEEVSDLSVQWLFAT